MPRRSKKTDNALGALILIILLILVILFLVVIITPLFFLFGFIIYFIRHKQFNKKVQGTLSDFWLNRNQKKEFKSLYEIIDSANIGVEEANKIADSKGINRNMDGSISARSNLGKQLRNAIEKNQEIISQNKGDFDTLKSQPFSHWKIYSKIYIRMNSFGMGLIFYLASALFLIKTEYDDLQVGLNNFISFPSKVFDGSYTETGDTRIMLITIAFSAFAYLIGLLVSKKRVRKKSPVPPLVDINNVDKY